jgi:NAD(P)-dependent dehydrogenase (short-subunit alcohol dehydrogenase family)
MKNIFITGISSGLGKGIAQYALTQGVKIWAMNRNEPDWETKEGILHFHPADFKNLKTLVTNTQGLLTNCEELDCIILNSGIISPIQDLKDTSMEIIQEVMNVNTWANKLILDAVFSSGIPVKQVVAISSGASVNGNRGWNAYSISKCALNMLIKLYSEEQEETHFTALAPGLIDSPMQDYLCGLVNNDKFPALEILKQARGTEHMPSEVVAGENIWKKIPKLLSYPSGSYVDVRNM